MENSDYLRLFAGKHVLIVEDEYFLADETRQILERLGATVVGPISNTRDAIELMETARIDAAILDIQFAEKSILLVAAELERKGIEFVFAIGSDPEAMPIQFSGFALCETPSELAKIALALFGTGADSTLN